MRIMAVLESTNYPSAQLMSMGGPDRYGIRRAIFDIGDGNVTVTLDTADWQFLRDELEADNSIFDLEFQRGLSVVITRP